MPAGDAGLAWQPWSEVEPGLRRRTEVGLQPRLWEMRAALAQLAAQQAVVEAARAALADIAGAASNRTPKTAMRYMARTAHEALDKAQAAQPEGERAV